MAHLEVPLLAPYVGVARAVVRAVASFVPGLDDDRLDDLRLAVSEVCTDAMSRLAEGRGTHLVLRCALRPDAFEVAVAGAAGGADDGAEEERAWSVELVRSLVDEVQLAGDDVRLLLRLDRG